MNRDPSLKLPRRVAALTTGVLLTMAVACGEDDINSSGDTVPATVSGVGVLPQRLTEELRVYDGNSDTTAATTTEATATTTTTVSRLDAIRAALEEDLPGPEFECDIDAVATGTVDFEKVTTGPDAPFNFVLRKDNSRLDVDINKTDELHRKFTDAPANPVTADLNSPEASIANVKASLCEDRLLLVTYANLLANTSVEGVPLKDIFPELVPYASTDGTVINDWAALFPQVRERNDLKTTADLAAYDDHTELAETVASIFGHFQVGAVETALPLSYYHLNPTSAMNAAGLQEVENIIGTYDQNNQFIPLKMTLKSGECVDLKIGINAHDQRIAILPSGCVVPPPPTTVETTIVTPSTESTSVPTTTGSTPTTPPNTPPPTPPTTLADKEPVTPTGSTAVATTIEEPEPGPANPTTSLVTETTSENSGTATTATIANSVPTQSSTVITTPPDY